MTNYVNIEMTYFVYDLVRDYLQEALTYFDDPADIIQLVHILDGWTEQKVKQEVKKVTALKEDIAEQEFVDELCEKFPDQADIFKDLYLKYLKGEPIDEEEIDNEWEDGS